MDNVHSGVPKWINHAVFLISVTAARIRKLLQSRWRGTTWSPCRGSSSDFSGEGLTCPAQVNDPFRRFLQLPLLKCFFPWLPYDQSLCFLPSVYRIHPTVDPPDPTWYRLYSDIMEMMGLASVTSQKMKHRSPLCRSCTWTHVEQSSSGMSGNCGSLAGVCHSTSRELPSPLMFHFTFRTSSKNTEECFWKQWWHTSNLYITEYMSAFHK